jgi:hypothetical protein
MKYETPEVTVLTTAINAVQGMGTGKGDPIANDGPLPEVPAAYADWE